MKDEYGIDLNSSHLDSSIVIKNYQVRSPEKLL